MCVAVWNPLTWLIVALNQVRGWEALTLVSFMGLVSVVIAVLWSGLFYRPQSRMSDWLTLIFLYCATSAGLQSFLPRNASWLWKARLLVPALMVVVWGAAWAWRYIDVLEAESVGQRFYLICSGVLYLVAAPILPFLTLGMIVWYLEGMPFVSLIIGSAIWVTGLAAIVNGILLERRARRLLALKEKLSG